MMQQHDGATTNNMMEYPWTMWKNIIQQCNKRTWKQHTITLKNTQKMQKDNKTMQQEKMLIKIIEN